MLYGDLHHRILVASVHATQKPFSHPIQPNHTGEGKPVTIRLTRPHADPILFLRGSEGGGGSEAYPLSESRLLAVRVPMVERLVRVAGWFFFVVLSSLV